MSEDSDLVRHLAAAIPRAQLVSDVQATLACSNKQAKEIVDAFDTFVAAPLEANLRKLTGRDLAKRNPMIYTTRGIEEVDAWVDQVLADKETSAIENHIGTFLEEVARIVAGGIKPGSGVDLQIERSGIVELYAIQAAPATKNAGGRRADVESLKRSARPLRSSRRHVDLFIAVLVGRRVTGSLRAEPDITILSSDDFWSRVSGTPDFRKRLFKASAQLSPLVKKRAANEVARIAAEARELYGDADGRLNLDAVADPPAVERRAKRRLSTVE